MYPQLTARLVSAVRQATVDARAVLNFTVAINAAPIWKNAMVDGVEQLVQVPSSDFFDVAVWDDKLHAATLTLEKGQEVTITPRSIKGGKPYETNDGRTIYTVRMTAGEIVPGAKPRNRAAAPAAVGAYAGGREDDLDELDDSIPF